MRIFRVMMMMASALLLLSAGLQPLAAQPDTDSPVLLGEHPYDIEAAEQGISEAIEAGYLPVGFEVTIDEAFTVLYVQSEAESINSWMIHEFESIETLEEEMNELLDAGWHPLDISYSQGRVFVLVADIGPEITGWRIHLEQVESSEQIESTIRGFGEENLSLWGLSFDEGLIWYLFLREGERPDVRALSLQSYPNEIQTIRSGLADQLNVGWSPWALLIEGTETLTIAYTAEVLFAPSE